MASCPSCRNSLDGSAVCSHCEAPSSTPQPDAPVAELAGGGAHAEDVPGSPEDGLSEDGPSEAGRPEEPATAVLPALPDATSDPATVQLRQVKPAAAAGVADRPVGLGSEAATTEVAQDDSAEAVAERAPRRGAPAAQLVPAAPVVADPGELAFQESEDPQRHSLRGAFIAAAAVLVLGAASAVALSSSSDNGSAPPALAPSASDSPSATDGPSDSASAKASPHAAPSHSAVGALHPSASPSHHVTPSPDPSQSIAPGAHSPARSSLIPTAPAEPTSRPGSSSPGDRPTPQHSCSVFLGATFCPNE